MKCNKLLSENTTAGITGSGTAHVFASVHLVAKVTGSGDIYYSGNPPSPEIQIRLEAVLFRKKNKCFSKNSKNRRSLNKRGYLVTLKESPLILS